MNLKNKILKSGSYFFSAIFAVSAFLQPTLAKTPADTLVMGWNVDALTTFDPAQINDVYGSEVVLNTCDTLVGMSPNKVGEIVPLLAKSWDVSVDDKGTAITFHLRDDLKFFDGRPAHADDFVWSLKRLVKLKLPNASKLLDYGVTVETVDDVIQTLDDNTFVMKFDKPYPANLILDHIASRTVGVILDRETIMKHEKDGDMGNGYLSTHTDCVGPYHLKSWRPGEAILLHANSNYWGKAPKIGKVLIRHVAEPSTQRLLLQKGDIDVARDLTSEDVDDLQKTTDTKIEKMLVPAMFYFGLETTNPIFANEKVRLAMRYLVDYDSLGKTILKGLGLPRSSFLPIGTLGALSEEEGLKFKLDIQKAKQLLIEAGYPDGFDAGILIGTGPGALSIAQSFQDNAAKIGINLTIERVVGSQLFSRMHARAFDVILVGWDNDSSDPHTMASRIVYNPDNRFEAKYTAYPSWQMGYFDEEMNRRVEDALFENDYKKRIEKYVDLQYDIMNKGPYVFLYQKYVVAAVAPSIKKWAWNKSSRVSYNLIEK